VVRLSTEHRRALDVLAGSANGCTEALLFAQGFTCGLIAQLILAGLARASMEQAAAGKRVTNTRRMRLNTNGGPDGACRSTRRNRRVPDRSCRSR
jgi:hypothetical protein